MMTIILLMVTISHLAHGPHLLDGYHFFIFLIVTIFHLVEGLYDFDDHHYL